jgi:hypothetical protein
MKRAAPHVIRIDRSLKIVRDPIFKCRSSLDQIKLPAGLLPPPCQPLFYFLGPIGQKIGRHEKTEHAFSRLSFDGRDGCK